MKHTKFKVQVTPEQSAEIQRALFDKGRSCRDQYTTVSNTDMPFMVIKEGKVLFYFSEAAFLEDKSVDHLFAHEALALIKASTSLKTPYVVDDREDRVAVRENTRTSHSVLDEATPGLIYLWKLGKTTMYNRQEDSTTHYRNEHRHDILANAYKLCDELNQKGED